jgi:virginiamycin A acetyltransferase
MHYSIKVFPNSGNSVVLRPNDPFDFYKLPNFNTNLFDIGKWSYISFAVLTHYFEPLKTIKIGSYCAIAENVTFMSPSNHHWDWISSYPVEIFNSFDRSNNFHKNQKNEINIGNNVWIGTGVTIMPGVCIADGSVIGANSTLTKSTEPFGIYAGNPASLIKFRFDTVIVERLLKIKWWDFNDQFIKDNLEVIFNKPTPEILDYLEICLQFKLIDEAKTKYEYIAEICA